MEAYNRLMTELQMDKSNHDRDLHPLILKQRQRLFGKVLIHVAPERYWELAVISQLPGGQLEWDSMNVSEQQERIAHVQLGNMIATLRAHHDIIEDNKRMEAIENARRSRGKGK